MDLGRSSHIHITTWGTLSRQKKGQRSKGTEGASIISFSRSLPQWGFDTSNKSHLPFMSCDAHVLLCSTSSDFVFFLEGWRGPPPAATEDNYTNEDKSASTVTHSRVGVFCRMQLAFLSNACAKTETKTGESGAGHTGERCAESCRRLRERGGTGSTFAGRVSQLDKLRSEIITLVKVPVTIVFFFFFVQQSLT